MSVNGGFALCLRRGFVSNVMSSTRLNAEQILAEVRNESEFRGKVEGMGSGVLDARLRGQDGGGDGRFFVLRGEQAGVRCNHERMLAVRRHMGKWGMAQP